MTPRGRDGWFSCFRHSSGWRWDDYQDYDLVRTLKDMPRADRKLRSGLAYNSRADHLVCGTHRHVVADYKTSEGPEAMRLKWGA